MRYASGEEIRCGDEIRYHGTLGTVDFVVSERPTEESLAWYSSEFGGEGVMLIVNGFGNVYLRHTDVDGDLQLIGRNPTVGP
jgi:hypothetical protein